MSKKNSRIISIGLLILGLASAVLLFVLFFARRAFTITTALNTTFGSLFTLAFGGIWEESSMYLPAAINYSANPSIAISFVFLIIAILIGLVLLYSVCAKRFLPKTNRILALVMVGLLLFIAINSCFTKNMIISTYLKEHTYERDFVNKNLKLSGNTITFIVFSFISFVSYLGFILFPLINKKNVK